jgi:hypothetical protein
MRVVPQLGAIVEDSNVTSIVVVVAVVVLPFALFALAGLLACRLDCAVGVVKGAKAGGFLAMVGVVMISLLVMSYGTPPGKVLTLAFLGSLVLVLWCAAIGATCGSLVEFGFRKTHGQKGSHGPKPQQPLTDR